MASAATTNTTGRDVVGTSVRGDGPKTLVDRAQTLRFVFHNFKGMQGAWMNTPPLEAFGELWELDVYPNGYRTELVSVYLKYIGDDTSRSSSPMRFVFRCKEYTQAFETHLFPKGGTWGVRQFLGRQDVLSNYLEEDGSLMIEVDLQRGEDDGKLVWYPKAIPTETFLKQLFMDAAAAMANNPTEEEIENDTTDVVFIVDENDYPVHKSVLRLHAKTLFAFYKEHTTGTDDGDDADDDDDGRARVHISAIDSKTFKKVLEFIYTVNTTPTLVDAVAATELLLAAHRFECPTLELYVESVMVDKFVTPTNAASMLLLGDTYHCALLKEAALKNSFADPISFRESSDPATAGAWSKIQDSRRLLSELYVYGNNALVATRNPTATDAGVVEGEDDTTRTMDVGDLREDLEKANLELDGSRAMLVTRLRNYRQQH